ncbi:MAG: hypothetical protein A2286_12060 [Gammaproteobacteria bacterium RIFOXYA12_FULL_61_12]|nr:MAG: hypothetical protein A2286_12060 [Gammaproteobacteria bacterium RIFOXYA12_FULL_61_12]
MDGFQCARKIPPCKYVDVCCLSTGSTCQLGEGLSKQHFASLMGIIRTRGTYEPGERIFKIEDDFLSLFVVQSGIVKIETVSQEGDNLVEGFYFQGNLIGLEAVGDRKYRYDAVALERTRLCEIPFAQLESLCSFIPRLQHRLLMLMGERIRQTNDVLLQGRHVCTEKKLLRFFQMLREKGQAERVHLPMSKTDIASYLGVRPESLSRALYKLKRNGHIQICPTTKEILLLSKRW